MALSTPIIESYHDQSLSLTNNFEQNNYNDIINKDYPSSMAPIMHEMLDIIKKDKNNHLLILTVTKLFERVLNIEDDLKNVNDNLSKKLDESQQIYIEKLNKLQISMEHRLNYSHNFNTFTFNNFDKKLKFIENTMNNNKIDILNKDIKIKIDELSNNLKNIIEEKLSDIKLDERDNAVKLDQDKDNNMKHLKNDIKWLDYYKCLNKLSEMNNNNTNNILQINKNINNIKDGIQENKKIISEISIKSQQLINGLKQYKIIVCKSILDSNTNITAGLNKIQRNIIAGMKDINDDIAAAEMAGAVARQCIKDKIKEAVIITTSTSTIKDDIEEVRLTMVLNKDINIPSTISDSDNLKDHDDKKGDIIINNGTEKMILSMVLNNDVIIPSIPSELKINDRLKLNYNDGLEQKLEMHLKKEDLVNMKYEELKDLLLIMDKKINIEDIKNEMMFRQILNERDKT